MERLIIIDHDSHESFIEDVSDEDLAKFNGEEEDYIKENYPYLENYSWDYVTSIEYTPIDNKSTYFEVDETKMIDIEAKLRKLYSMACDYICGGETTPISVIEFGVDIYASYPCHLLHEDIQEILGKCLTYANKDFDPPKEFCDYVAECEEMMEDISGVLGEHLDV